MRPLPVWRVRLDDRMEERVVGMFYYQISTIIMNKHFEISSRKQLDDDFIRLFDTAYNTNYMLFNKPIPRFKIIACHSNSEFKKEARYYYTKWATATVLRNGNLVIKHPDISTKWKKSDYPDIINHEMNHVFWTLLYKTTKPAWLEEGMASSIGKNFSKYSLKKLINDFKINSKILHYRYIKRKVTGHIPFYPIWQGFTDYLVNRFGSGKIIILMNKYSKNPVKDNYHKLFGQIFGKSEIQLFNEFLKSTNADHCV